MSWIYYLLEANFYLTVFYALYYFIFRRETWYQLNRIYLLVSTLLAFVIPFIQLGFLKAIPLPVEEIVIEPVAKTAVIKTATVVLTQTWSITDYFLAGYLLIVFVLLINLFIKITKLVWLSRKHKNRMVDSYKLIETTGEPDAFSFFNYLFIDPELASRQTVIHHELIHIRQRHSWDIILVEILKIINWFNPLVYWLQYSVKELHEFIADSETVKSENDPAAYTDFLVNNAYGITGNTLISTFFNKSLLKNRIIMLHQKPSGSLARLKYLATIPLCAALLCASTLTFSKTYGWIDLAPGHAPVAKIKANAGKITDPHDAFYLDLARRIRYPADARINDNAGLLMVTFTVDATGKIQKITTVGELLPSIKGEVVRVLQTADASSLKPSSKYTLPVRFLITKKDGKTTGSDTDKPKAGLSADSEGTEVLKEVVIVTYL